MDKKIRNQSVGVNIWPEKLYTQHEVDDLLEEKDGETQTADKQKRLDSKTVAKLVKKSNRILVSISSYGFPFTLFPDTINVEEGRITIITRSFFSSSQVHSVDMKDISNVFINTSLFFAQLVIVSKTFAENEIRIKNLKKEEAVFARRIIEGLRIFENKQLDTSKYTKQELVAKLEELSTTEIVT